MSARPLSASVAALAGLALAYYERSTQANIHHIENPRQGSYVLVTPRNSDAPGAIGAALAKQEIHWCAEVNAFETDSPLSPRSSTIFDLGGRTEVDAQLIHTIAHIALPSKSILFLLITKKCVSNILIFFGSRPLPTP